MPKLHAYVVASCEAQQRLENIDGSDRPDYIIERATLEVVLAEIGAQYLSDEFHDYETLLAAYEVLAQYRLLEWRQIGTDVHVHMKLLLESDCMALEQLIALR